MRALAALLALVLAYTPAMAQDRWVDRVVDWEFGTGGGFGQEYLPDNLLGPPDPAATFTVPASGADQLLTLGDGGWVTLAFEDNRVTDGPGPDLRICENPFRVGGNPDQVWTEPAIIELSADGVQWITVPWDSTTHEGLAGRAPVNGSADPGDPEAMGGDLVDLAGVGLPEVAFVRLRDLPGDGRSFDLDAVGALRLEAPTPVAHPVIRGPGLALYPNPGTGRFTVGGAGLARVEVYTISGRRLLEHKSPGTAASLDLGHLPNGVYLVAGTGQDGSRRLARLTLAR
jgi:hypothetical protein